MHALQCQSRPSIMCFFLSMNALLFLLFRLSFSPSDDGLKESRNNKNGLGPVIFGTTIVRVLAEDLGILEIFSQDVCCA